MTKTKRFLWVVPALLAWVIGGVSAGYAADTIRVTKTADPPSVTELGGTVTFTVLVENTSAADSVTLGSLSDSLYGSLDGQGTCSVPQTIPPGGSYGCSFAVLVVGNAGDMKTDVVIASGVDSSGNLVSASDDATVAITGVPPPIPVARGVTGTLTIAVGLEPESTQTESSQFTIDFETLGDIAVELSGLSFGTELALGVAGLEHVIFSHHALLGALDMLNEFVFAAPFNSDGARIGGVLFVKSRMTQELELGGVSLTNLAIYEDTGFIHPFPATVQSYSAQTQTFRFGDLITLSGETSSGIRLRSVTGICADPDLSNSIKKKTYPTRVCDNGLELTVERIYVDDLTIGELEIDSQSEFRLSPLAFKETLVLTHPLGALGTGKLTLSTEDVINLSPVSAVVSLDFPAVMMALIFDPLLTLTSVLAQVQVSLGVANLFTSLSFIPGTGLTAIGFTTHLTSKEGVSLIATTALSNPTPGPPPGFADQTTAFTLTAPMAPWLELRGTSTFTDQGLSSAGMKMVLKF